MERRSKWQTPGAPPEKQFAIVACFYPLTRLQRSDCSSKDVPSCVPVMAMYHLCPSYTVVNLLAA